MYLLVYNPLAKNHHGKESLEEVISLIHNQAYKAFSVLDYPEGFAFFKNYSKDDNIIVIGGDGTLSVFINQNPDLPQRISFYSGGTGNDFMRMFKDVNNDNFVDYTGKVDSVSLKTEKENVKVLNTLGAGLDGSVIYNYSKQKSPSNLSYKIITVLAFLSYKPTDVVLKIDGEVKEFKKCYLAVIGNGKYIGGGIDICPHANPNDGYLDICVIHSLSRLKLLLCFKSAFSGQHLETAKKYVYYKRAKEIEYHAKESRYLQYDGELIKEKVKDYVVTINE